MGDDLLARQLCKSLRRDLDEQLGWLTSRINLLLALQGNTVVFDVTLAAFRAGNYSGYTAVALQADADGEPGIFVKVTGSAADDGRNNIKDSIGTLFTRRSFR